MRVLLLLLICEVAICGATFAEPPPRWLALPPTPGLPKPDRSGYAPLNGVRIWYAIYGKGDPVILLHGGMAYSGYWGYQITELAKHHQVIVMDSRGHGRSTRSALAISYHLMATDVLGLMDFLKVTKASVVGWSDGGIIGLDLAIHHPERLTRLFAFGANSDTSGVKSASQSGVFKSYLSRVVQEYGELSPAPGDFEAFRTQLSRMWNAEPNFTADQLRSIKVTVWIVDGKYDEIIKRDHTVTMAKLIPHARLVIEKDVSHFAFLQDPRQFNGDLVRFLEDHS